MSCNVLDMCGSSFDKSAVKIFLEMKRIFVCSLPLAKGLAQVNRLIHVEFFLSARSRHELVGQRFVRFLLQPPVGELILVAEPMRLELHRSVGSLTFRKDGDPPLQQGVWRFAVEEVSNPHSRGEFLVLRH